MLIRLCIHIVKNATVALAMVLALVPIGVCQTGPVDESESAPSDPPDEITVYGNKTLFNLRREWRRAEVNFFDVFNSLNSTDDYDLDCGREVWLGSRRVRHVCRPEFVEEFDEAEASAILEELLSQVSISAGPRGVAVPNWAVRQKMEQLM